MNKKSHRSYRYLISYPSHCSLLSLTISDKGSSILQTKRLSEDYSFKRLAYLIAVSHYCLHRVHMFVLFFYSLRVVKKDRKKLYLQANMSCSEKPQNKNKQKTKKHTVFQKKEYESNKQTDQTNINQNEKDTNERHKHQKREIKTNQNSKQ